jgi:hypothetical protein
VLASPLCSPRPWPDCPPGPQSSIPVRLASSVRPARFAGGHLLLSKKPRSPFLHPFAKTRRAGTVKGGRSRRAVATPHDCPAFQAWRFPRQRSISNSRAAANRARPGPPRCLDTSSAARTWCRVNGVHRPGPKANAKQYPSNLRRKPLGTDPFPRVVQAILGVGIESYYPTNQHKPASRGIPGKREEHAR